MNNEIQVGYFIFAVVCGAALVFVMQSVIWGLGGFFGGYALALLNELRKAHESGEL